MKAVRTWTWALKNGVQIEITSEPDHGPHILFNHSSVTTEELRAMARAMEEALRQADILEHEAPIPEATIQGGSWQGEKLTTLAFQLAGALSRTFLNPNDEMPSQEIDRIVGRVLREGAR